MEKEQLVQMIEVCLNQIEDDMALAKLSESIMQKRLSLAGLKKRSYVKKEVVTCE